MKVLSKKRISKRKAKQKSLSSDNETISAELFGKVKALGKNLLPSAFCNVCSEIDTVVSFKSCD